MIVNKGQCQDHTKFHNFFSLSLITHLICTPAPKMLQIPGPAKKNMSEKNKKDVLLGGHRVAVTSDHDPMSRSSSATEM
jgi:hypothetical protein